MSTLKGANRTKGDTPTGSNILDPGVFGGNVKVSIDTYTILGTEVDTDIIQMGKKLPKGSRVIEQQLSANASVAATVTVDVGDAEDVDRYMAAVDLSSAAINRIDEPDSGCGYKIDETDEDALDSQIILTLHTMTTPVAGSIITLVTTYTNE